MEDKRPNMSKTFSMGVGSMMGVGPPLHKQLKFAILEGNEDKAIGIYNAKEMGKLLKSTLHPSKPFPSKKDPNGETPLHLSAKFALAVLFGMFLEFGGRPDIINSRRENCIHTVCSQGTNPTKRAEIVDEILKWRSVNPSTNKPVAVPVDAVDIDGNTAIHLAAYNGLLLCIEKLLSYNVSTAVLNNSNLTCAEYADLSGRTNIGSMVELACLFRAAASAQRLGAARADYRDILQAHGSDGRGIVYIDSDSLTAQSLMKFVARMIAHVASALKESPARSEVLLMHFNWDARSLISEYKQNPEKVLRSVKIAYRNADQSNSDTNSNEQALTVSNESEGALIVHGSDNVPVGVPIAEVFLDPSYEEVGPFAVYRGGKKVTYTIRTVHGKTAVVPLDFDPHAKMLMPNDQKVSPNSHLKPDTTSACPMCGELMYEAASVQHFIADTLVEPRHRELQCGSGHKYCFSCWCGYLQAQAAGEDGLHCLQCPSVNCGESLDLHWAPVLLKSPDLLNRMFAQRQRLIIERLRLRWCPLPNCGLIVHVHSTENEESRGSDCAAGCIPLCGVCSNGHGFCLCCGGEGHSPCKCEELLKWQDLVREFSRSPQAKDRTNAAHILLHAPNHKACLQCGASNGKVDGCNRMRCTGCFREFCWICQQSWAQHDPSSRNPRLSGAGSRDSAEESREAAFQCNLWQDAATMTNGLPDRQSIFLRYFARYQAQQESFQLETAAFKNTVDRITHDLKASYDGDLDWLLGTNSTNPYSPVPVPAETNGVDGNSGNPALSEAYLPREQCLEFLTEAYQELERCRLLLRWSYPCALFQFEDEFCRVQAPHGMMLALADRSEYRSQFTSAQAVLEHSTEALSDLLSHKRLRGSQEDITVACLAAKGARVELEAVIVNHNPAFGSQTLEFSRSMSVDNRRSLDSKTRGSREMQVVPTVHSQGPLQTLNVAPAQARQPTEQSTVGGVSSYTRAMEIDLGHRKQEHHIQSNQQSRQVTSTTTETKTVQQSQQQTLNQGLHQQNSERQQTRRSFPDVSVQEEDDYGYSSADEEGLQVCNDVSAMKLEVSPHPLSQPAANRNSNSHTAAENGAERRPTSTGKAQAGVTATSAAAATQRIVEAQERVSLEHERAVQRNVEQVHTTTTTTTQRVLTSASGKLAGQTNSGSGNSLISDLTSPEFNSSGNMSSALAFSRISKINSSASELSPPKTSPHPSPLLAQATTQGRGAGLVKTSSLSSKQLTREVNKVFQKRIVEHISQEETTIIYQLMSKHRISRDKAVRMYLEEHDERLYNPKAVYLFPGEEYVPEEDVDDEEEERRKDALYGRVEYRAKNDGDSWSEASPATVEQRLIGAKKDPDQEALEHALLLSAQEQEFGINMYDSLTSADQLILHEYISQGFTREEGALIIFEEKFGKTKNLQNTSVIPAMPTLRAVHGTHSHTGTDRSSGGLGYGSELGDHDQEEDDEEVQDLICRGYTREQAIAVIQVHRERAQQAAATSHPTDPTHYDPHPREEQFNLSEREERAVEDAMNRRGCSRRAAVESVVQMRTSSASHTHSSSYGGSTSYEDSTASSALGSSGESYEVRQYMDRGYTREQALQLVRSKAGNGSASSTDFRRPSATSSHSGGDSVYSSHYEDADVAKYMSRGYTREQATEIVKRESSSRRATSTNDSLTYSPAPIAYAAVHAANVVPADLDPATAELVRQQDEDHGTNMFLEITPQDDPEVERLMLEGYQYHEALLEIFNARYPPRPMGRQYTAGYSPAPPPQFPPVHSQSFYQQPPPVQYPPASQSFYMPQYAPAPYANQSFYGQPMGQSFYQQQPGYGMQMPPDQQGMYPTQFASKPGHARRPSNGSNSGGGGGNGKPPVLNGTQQSMLQQKRQDKERAAQQAAAGSGGGGVAESGNGKELGGKKSSSLLRKSSFLTGMARKTASTEDDIMARATHMSGADSGHHEQDKEKIPKLKYKEADVQKIVKMGFARDQAVQALVENHHNVEEAVHMLTSM